MTPRVARLRSLALAGALLALGGCATLIGATPLEPDIAPGTSFHTLHSGGHSRTYLLHVPPGYDRRTPLPLLIVLHGSNGNANRIMERSRMNDEADRGHFLVAYPNGTGWLPDLVLTWNSGNCCGDALAAGVNDVGFLHDLARALEHTLAVDSSRVYVAGFSDGGRLAYRAACDLAPELAGVAIISGAMPDTVCRPAAPIPVIIFHGTGDPRIHYGSRLRHLIHLRHRPRTLAALTIPEIAHFWAARDGCTPVPQTEAAGRVTRERFTGCRDHSAVVLYTIAGGGHSWPWNVPGPGATPVIWSFFEAHRR